MGKWSIAHDACVRCGTADHPHDAQGYCEPCYRAAKASGELIQRKGPDLKKGKWSLKFDVCTRCHQATSPHKARGVCHNCYQAERRVPTGRPPGRPRKIPA